MAFVCGHCKTSVTTPPDLQKIPNAWTQISGTDYANHVFTPCGHVFHLGCIAETFAVLENLNRETACPSCGAGCGLDGLTKLYPIIQQKDPPEVPEEPEGKKEEEQEPPKPYSMPHLVLAFMEFSLVLHICFLDIAFWPRTNRSDYDEDYDHEMADILLNPHWMLSFYIALAIGIFCASIPALVYDLWYPE